MLQRGCVPRAGLIARNLVIRLSLRIDLPDKAGKETALSLLILRQKAIQADPLLLLNFRNSRNSLTATSVASLVVHAACTAAHYALSPGRASSAASANVLTQVDNTPTVIDARSTP